MADADPDDARERPVPRRHRRRFEQQRCPPGPRYEPLDGRHGAQGLRVVALAGKPKYLYHGIGSVRVRQHGLAECWFEAKSAPPASGETTVSEPDRCLRL